MDLPPAKKTCVKCKSVGIGICQGCRKSFCDKHFPEHRQDLAQRFDNISDDYERFQQDMEYRNDPKLLLQRIDAWEKESITKIQTAAQAARDDLQQYSERTKNELNKKIENITNELQLCRESNNFTEADISHWSQYLKQLQSALQKPPNIRLADDENQYSFIRFIKVKYVPTDIDVPRESNTVAKKIYVPQPVLSPDEEGFFHIAGRGTISEQGQMIKCTGYASVCGNKQYFNGTNRIRFRILTKKNDGLFFGVVSDLQQMTARTTELASVYGWRDFDRAIVNGKSHTKNEKEKIMRAGDELTLLLDCDKRQVILTHHRTRKSLQQPIDTEECPFPWRFLVSSYGDDCVTIIH